MADATTQAGYKTYIGTWAALLLLTVGMLATGAVSLGRGALILLLLGAMLAKVSLIGAYFMHLKFEHKGLILGVVLSLAGTAFVMFILMAWDSYAISTQLAN